MINSITMGIHSILLIGLCMFLWHVFIMVTIHNKLAEEFSDSAPHLCNCGLDVYKNIYYICSNNHLVNLVNQIFSGEIIAHGTILTDYDPYSLIFPPTLKWGKYQCMEHLI